MTIAAQKHLFTVHDFHRLSAAGLLLEDARLELIKGELFDISPIGSFHAVVVDRLANSFYRTLAGAVQLRIQGPIRLDDYSEPQPDIAPLKPRAGFYKEKYPVAEDILLLIEIDDTSIKYDRNIKLPLYAQSSIPEVWLVDLNQRRVEVYLDPVLSRYQKVYYMNPGQTIMPRQCPHVTVNVTDIFA